MRAEEVPPQVRPKHPVVVGEGVDEEEVVMEPPEVMAELDVVLFAPAVVDVEVGVTPVVEVVAIGTSAENTR